MPYVHDLNSFALNSTYYMGTFSISSSIERLQEQVGKSQSKLIDPIINISLCVYLYVIKVYVRVHKKWTFTFNGHRYYHVYHDSMRTDTECTVHSNFSDISILSFFVVVVVVVVTIVLFSWFIDDLFSVLFTENQNE